MQMIVKLETIFFTFAPQHDSLQGSPCTLTTQTRKPWLLWGAASLWTSL